MRYAQINASNICVADSTLSGEVTADNLIPLDENDPSPLGKLWNGSTWEDMPEPEPEPIRTLTKLQFRNRFTFPEKQAIYAAAEVSVDIRIFLDDINAAENINLDDPATIGGVQALEAGGLIAAGRAVEILS